MFRFLFMFQVNSHVEMQTTYSSANLAKIHQNSQMQPKVETHSKTCVHIPSNDWQPIVSDNFW